MDEPSQGPRGSIRFLYADDTVSTAQSGPLCIVVWRGAVTPAPFERQRAALAEVVEQHASGVAFVCVVEATAKAPNDELRRASGEMVMSHGDKIKCVAVIIEGEGFGAAVARAALTSMVLLARPLKAPLSVFGRADAAARWMAKHIRLDHPDDLPSLVERVRARMPAPTAHR
jgi:hypothetical protein